MQRKILLEFSKASKEIELTEVAANILEGVSGMKSVVKTLRRKQQTMLKKIDAASAKLGAPYGS